MASWPSRATSTWFARFARFNPRIVSSSSSGLSSTSNTLVGRLLIARLLWSVGCHAGMTSSPVAADGGGCAPGDQAEVERRALIHGGVCPDDAAVAMHGPHDGREADPVARKLAFAVKSMEGTKQPWACAMSNPAPLSATKYTGTPFCSVAPKRMQGCVVLEVNLYALASRFCSTVLTSSRSASATSPSSISMST